MVRANRDIIDPAIRQRNLAILHQPLPPNATEQEILAHFRKVDNLATEKPEYVAPDNVIKFIENVFDKQKPEYRQTPYVESWQELCKSRLPSNSVVGKGIPTWNPYMRPALKRYRPISVREF